MAALGIAALFATAYAFTPPARRQRLRVGGPVALALFVLRALVSRDPRYVLWLAFAVGLVASLSVLTLLIPRGSVAYQDLTYSEQRRRGLRSGALALMLIVATLVGSFFWVQ